MKLDRNKRYEAPKIYQTMLKAGIKVSIKRVQRLMKMKKYRPYLSKESGSDGIPSSDVSVD
jgi:putative transposase